MKVLKRTWTLGFLVAGLIAIRFNDAAAAMIGLPPRAGGWIMIGAGVAMWALAIAPYFVFRRN